MDRTASYDVVVVGGGLAGLSAALVLGRSLRRTLVLDAGEPRNAPSSGVHGFISRDGILPEELLRIAGEELEQYPTVEIRQVLAVEAKGKDGCFVVALADGSAVATRKLLLATGVRDQLPDKPGFQELWGRGVYHCPYCHGWEVRGTPLAIMNATEDAGEQVEFMRNWSRDLVLLTDGPSGLDDEGQQRLRALGVPIVEKPIARLEGDPNGEKLWRVVFEDGSLLERQGIFCAPPQCQRSELAESLGCEIDTSGSQGAVIEIDHTTGQTTVPGVYAAGDASASLSESQSAIMAAASGASAASLMNHELVTEDTEAEIQHAFRESDTAVAADAG